MCLVCLKQFVPAEFYYTDEGVCHEQVFYHREFCPECAYGEHAERFLILLANHRDRKDVFEKDISLEEFALLWSVGVV